MSTTIVIKSALLIFKSVTKESDKRLTWASSAVHVLRTCSLLYTSASLQRPLFIHPRSSVSLALSRSTQYFYSLAVSHLPPQ